jgi:hypothetical protein
MGRASSGEKRRDPRAYVKIEIDLERSVGRPVKVRTIDIGCGGALVRASRPLKVDEQLHFDLDLPPHLDGTARVLRQERLDVYALRWENLEPGSIEELRAFIEATSRGRVH